jgi:hypothetical protein
MTLLTTHTSPIQTITVHYVTDYTYIAQSIHYATDYTYIAIPTITVHYVTDYKYIAQ